MQLTLNKLAVLFISAMFTLGFSSCKITLQGKRISKVLSSDYCAQPYQDGPRASYQMLDSVKYAFREVSHALSKEELELANAIGILRQIKSRTDLRNPDNAKSLALMRELDFDIENRISFANNIINSIAAEIHCESERTQRIAGYLDDLGKKRVNKFTIGAIFSGAATGVAPLIVKNQNPQNAIVIAGSAISAGLGVAALTNNRKKVEFTYTRNLLADIWYLPGTSKVYPDFLWLMLKQTKDGTNGSTSSVASDLKRRWLSLEFNQNIDKDLESLLFGKGGIYTEDKLNTRQVLLDQLQSEVQLSTVKLLALSRKLKTY